MIDLDSLDFAKGRGLVPVVAQDASTGAVLMVAYADREAVARDDGLLVHGVRRLDRDGGSVAAVGVEGLRGRRRARDQLVHVQPVADQPGRAHRHVPGADAEHLGDVLGAAVGVGEALRAAEGVGAA